jgi:hypothetical protein
MTAPFMRLLGRRSRVLRTSACSVIVLVSSVEVRAQDRLWTNVGDAAQDRLGYQLGIVGDVNGDGVPDVAAVKASNSGVVRFLDGKTGQKLFRWAGPRPQPSRFADVDGDGVEEVLLSSDVGLSTVVMSGKTHATLYSLGVYYAADVGDVDGDGIDDVAGYMKKYSAKAKAYLGEIDVYSGKNGASLLTIAPSGRGAYFGRQLACMGDWNGDGVPDLIASVDGTAAATLGDVVIFSLKDGSALLGEHGVHADSTLGPGLELFDDVDQDGVADVVATEMFETVGGITNAGVVRILSGATLQTISEFDGVAAFNYLHLQGVPGDVDGDGWRDLVFGTIIGTEFWIYSGRTQRRLYALQVASSYANQVARGPFDVDGDGLDDVVWSDPDFDFTKGAVNVEHGRTAFLTAEPLWRPLPAISRPLPSTSTSTTTSGTPPPPPWAPSGAASDETFHFHFADFQPGSSITLAVVELDGSATYALLGSGTADGFGEWETGAAFIPPDPYGHTWGVQAVGTDHNGRPITTSIERFGYH